MSDRAGFVTGTPMTGTVGSENDTRDRSTSEASINPSTSSEGETPGDPALDPPATRGGSLSSVLRTLREAAAAHDGQARTPALPDTGPLSGRRDKTNRAAGGFGRAAGVGRRP